MMGHGQGDPHPRGATLRLEAAREALAGLGEVLHEASGPELAGLMGDLDAVAAQASAGRASVAVEAVRRGECSGGEVHAWVREHAPSLRQGGAASVARLAHEVAGARSGSGLDASLGPDPQSPVGVVWSQVASGALDASTATSVLRESARLVPLLRPDTVPTVTTALVDLAQQWGPSLMRRLRPRLLADHGHHGALDDLQHRLTAAARLSMPHLESGDLTEYQLWMTPDQAATLEAAIGPLTAPAPNPETGEADLRPAGQRRVEALTQVCQAASGIDAATRHRLRSDPARHHHPGRPPRRHRRRRGPRHVADGTLLAPDTLRRLACDAALIPHVLGTENEPLTLGRVARLFTRAQRRHLWLRDRGCTWPGCTAPPAWARAHHVRHWADDGPTDTTNAALLCQRHHTTVHRRRLWADVPPPPTTTAATSPGTWSTAPTTEPTHPRRPRPRPPHHRRHCRRRLASGTTTPTSTSTSGGPPSTSTTGPSPPPDGGPQNVPTCLRACSAAASTSSP